LARLALSEDERESMRVELTKILDHAEKIQALNLDGVEPTAHAIPLRNVMRPDEARPSLPPHEALSNAPEQEDGRFLVPRIVEDA
jgi:aspartyl-tRNA(Asn)/glutamyl-tRNA(Gln) amidotransferase subunit C